MGQSLFELLQQYDGRMLPFHMPGHKRNTALAGMDGYLAALGAGCDITEVDGFDSLAEPSGVLKELKERAAGLYHSGQTELLVNGSTCGILAAIEAAVPYGGTVLVARNCHKSVYNGLRLKNAKVRYLLPPVDEQTGIAGAISCEEVRQALWPEGRIAGWDRQVSGQEGRIAGWDRQASGQSERISLLILTSPTYEGISSDVRGICEIAHEYRVPVLVDAAHGAHFGFGDFPESAVAAGADLVVQSLHKTLPSLTQTALLHQNGTLVSPERVQQAVNIFQTSSPSYLFLASIDGCVRLMEKKELWDNWEAALSVFYERAREWKVLSLPVMEMVETWTEAGKTPAQGDGKNMQVRARLQPDKSKLVIGTEHAGKTGAWLMDKLRQEYHIELEMAAGRYVIAMTGAGDTAETVGRLVDALCEIDRELEGVREEERKKEPNSMPYPEIIYTAADTEQMPHMECSFQEAAGKIAAEYVFAYPPGIPLLVPGERITEEILTIFSQYAENGIRLHGNNGVVMETILVVK